MAYLRKPLLFSFGLFLFLSISDETTSSEIRAKSFSNKHADFHVSDDNFYGTRGLFEFERHRRSVRTRAVKNINKTPCLPHEQFDPETYQCSVINDDNVEPRLPFVRKRFTNAFFHCSKMALDKSMFILRKDGLMDVPILSKLLLPGEYGMMNSSDQAFICYPEEYQDCMRWELFPDEYTLLANKSLYSHMHGDIHEFGHYKINENGRAVVCFRAEFGQTENLVFRNILFAGWILSQIGLLLTFALQVNCKVKMSSFRKSLLCYTCSMFAAYFSLSVAEVAMPYFPSSLYVCLIVFIQLSFLATFSWLNVLCFDICRDFRMLMTGHTSERTGSSDEQPGHTKFLWYSAYGWSWPILLSVVTIILDMTTLHDSPLKPAFVDGMWFSGPLSGVLLFYGPMGTSLACNLFLFCYTLWVIMKVTSGTSTQVKHARTRWLSAIKVFLVMGISWIFEVMSWATHAHSLVWFFTDIINSIHGVFIFLIFNWAWIKSTALYFHKRWTWAEDTQQLDEALDGVVQQRPPPDIQMVQKSTAVSALAEDLAQPKRYTQLEFDAENPNE